MDTARMSFKHERLALFPTQPFALLLISKFSAPNIAFLAF